MGWHPHRMRWKRRWTQSMFAGPGLPIYWGRNGSFVGTLQGFAVSPFCGDGFIDGTEECDDGNNANGDCCSGTCAFELVGSACGDQGIDCLVNDACDGVGACTDNGFEAAATACGDPSNTACDDPDSCDGAGTCNANFETVGFACPDGDLCNGDELCNGAGSCQVGPSLDCDDLDVCTADSCDQISGCANEPIPGCGAPVPSGSLGSRAVLALLMLALATVFLRQRRGVRA